MTGLVFVDTNVLLYAIDSRDAAKHHIAREWMERLWQDRNGRTGVQVLSEFYVNATRTLTPPLERSQAWQHVLALREWQPQPVDLQVLEVGQEVQRRHGLNWWDSLVVGAARLQGCATLLTEDLQHGAVYAGVSALNPFRSGISEARTIYAPRLEAPLRRGRGRPRKAAAPA
jgi:predicted nucleic acid-binding protein